MSADRCVSSRDASYPSPPFLNPSLEKNHFFRGGSEGSPVTETTITSSMRRMVVVDPWRGDTRGDTRSFVDLLDGVHATTSNAHGPAAFSPRTRCRSASRREMMVRPGVSSSTHAPYLYALRGADGLRADHFYLTRSRTDWLSAGTGREWCLSFSFSLVVVGSAATQPSPTRYDLWGRRDRDTPRARLAQIRGILGLKRGSGVKR